MPALPILYIFQPLAILLLLILQYTAEADILVKTATVNTINYEDFSLLCADGIPLLMQDHRPRPCQPRPWLPEHKCPTGFWCHEGDGDATFYCCPRSRRFSNRCHLPPAVGYGKQAMRRFYYDWKTDGCHELQYTGIGGNENSFLTYEKCEAVCRGAGEPPISLPSNIKIATKGGDKKIPIEKQGSVKQQTPGPPIDANIPLATWATFTTAEVPIQQATTSALKSHEIYSAVKIDSKPSASSNSHSMNNKPSILSSHHKGHTQTEPVPFAANPCSLPPDKGKPGGVARKFFYFDMSSLSCVLFTYLGSGGNSNRFESATVCTRVCGIGKPTRRSCDLPPAAGNGPFKIPRYYFDASSKTCERFYYTGKDGNDNRFHKKHKCERLCLGRKTTTKHKGYETSTSSEAPSTTTFTNPPITTTDRIFQSLVPESTISSIPFPELSTVDFLPEIFEQTGSRQEQIGSIYTGNNGGGSYEETPPPLPRPPIQPPGPIPPYFGAGAGTQDTTPNSGIYPPFQPPPSSNVYPKLPFEIVITSSEAFTTTQPPPLPSSFSWNQIAVTVPPFEEMPSSEETATNIPFPTLIYEPRGEQIPRMTAPPNQSYQPQPPLPQPGAVPSQKPPSFPPSSSSSPVSATLPPYLLPNQTPPNIDMVFSRLISNQESFIAPLLGLSTAQPTPDPESSNLLPYLPQIINPVSQQGLPNNLSNTNLPGAIPAYGQNPNKNNQNQNQLPQAQIPSSNQQSFVLQPFQPLPQSVGQQPYQPSSASVEVQSQQPSPSSIDRKSSYERVASAEQNGQSQSVVGNIPQVPQVQPPSPSYPTLIEQALTNNNIIIDQPPLNITLASHENSPCLTPLVGDATILCADGNVQCPASTFCQIGEGASICCPILAKPPCQQPPVEGIGLSSIARWYFDPSSNLCLPFLFKGFKGNQNNFVSFEACRRSCGARTVCANGDPLMPEPANLDCATGASSCALDYSCTAVGAGYSLCCPANQQPVTGLVTTVAPSASPCEQRIDSGFGSDNHHRWAYDGGQCVSFLYKGFGGNQNNFLTRQDCESICKGQPSIPPRCNHPAASGHGQEYLMRYFYSQEYHQCLHFIYSGEGGNENNFGSLAECLETCVANGVKFSSLAFNPPIQTTTFSFTFLPSRICPQGDPITMEDGQPLQCDWRRNARCPGETVCSPVGESGFCCPSPMSYCLQSRPPISVCTAPNYQPVQEIRFTYDPLADKCVRFSYANCSPQVQQEASLNMFASNSQCRRLCCNQGYNLVYKRRLLMKNMNDQPIDDDSRELDGGSNGFRHKAKRKNSVKFVMRKPKNS